MMRIDQIGECRVLFTMATEPEYGARLRERIVPLMTGVGPIEAALATGIALKTLQAEGSLPDVVVSLGSAASRCCALGTVHQVRSVVWRDMDASPLGFPKGVTPFTDRPAEIALWTPVDGVPLASLSTGADVVSGDALDGIGADLADMETFAVVWACQRFDVRVIGLRGISDGPGELRGMESWTELLKDLDERLAETLDLLPAALSRNDA